MNEQNLQPCKKGETHNPNGRPKKLSKAISAIPKDAQEKIYAVLWAALQTGDKSEGAIILQRGKEELPEYGMIYQLAIKELLGKNGWKALNDILDRLFGKPKQITDTTLKTEGAGLIIGFKKAEFRADGFQPSAEALAADGVKELILVAQETTVYGIDLYNEKYLPKLIDELSEIEGIEWIRILYAYPEEIDDELIKVIKNNDKVCKYLDLPIQHSSDTILMRMGRRTSNKDLRQIISKLRREIPDITLRTSLISGFPGETDEDHNNLVSFVKEIPVFPGNRVYQYKIFH